MKKLFLTTSIALLSLFITTAQSEIGSKIYSENQDLDDVLALSLSYDLIDVLDFDLDLDDQMKHVSGDIYQIKFIAFSEDSQPESKLLAINQKLAASEMRLIKVPLDAEDDDLQMLKFYGVKKGGYYSDICMLMLSEDSNTGFFVALNGKIKINKES